MTKEMTFLREQAFHVELHYKGFRIWLEGSDKGWWNAKRMNDKATLIDKRGGSAFSSLLKVKERIDESLKISVDKS